MDVDYLVQMRRVRNQKGRYSAGLQARLHYSSQHEFSETMPFY